VVEGAEPVGEASGLLDDEVDRFGAAVADLVDLEPGQDVLLLSPYGPSESGDLGDRAGRDRGDDLLCDCLAAGGVGGLVHRPELLVAVPSGGHA
jgi:hypothetical protein